MFIDLITRRRSVRRFEDRPVEKEKLDLLMETALRSPSSRSLNPWEFLFVTDPEVITHMAAAKPHGASFLKYAPLAVVVCADPDRCDVWVEDAAIASIYLHLASEALGLGSCWIQIRKRMHDDEKSAEAHIAGRLNLPENLRVLSIIAIGYPAEKKAPHDKAKLQYEKIHFDRFGQQTP